MGITDLTVLAYDMGTLSSVNCDDTLPRTLMRARGRIHLMKSARESRRCCIGQCVLHGSRQDPYALAPCVDPENGIDHDELDPRDGHGSRQCLKNTEGVSEIAINVCRRRTPTDTSYKIYPAKTTNLFAKTLLKDELLYQMVHRMMTCSSNFIHNARAGCDRN